MGVIMPEWKIKTFGELNAKEVYEILALRINVFVVEQFCPYPEADGKDAYCTHVMGYIQGRLAAYARIVGPGVSYKEVSIGRVATAAEFRGTGLGKDLMKLVLDTIPRRFGSSAIRISAQSYLIPFYSSFGFYAVGEEYLEDDMPHMEMLRPEK